MELQPREIEVLSIIVKAYIENALPVGSRYVAKKSSLSLSPATMRNIMADLTEKGYLAQPYTSAGRVPTEQAFRYYVDFILEPGPLPNDLQSGINNYFKQSDMDFSELLEQASRLISLQANQVGMAVAPQSSQVKFQHIDFVLVRAGLVMSILVFEGGIIQNKLISVDKKIGADDLVKYANFLNEKFKGYSIGEIKKNVLEEMKKAESDFNHLYFKAMNLAKDALKDKDPKREIFLEGTLHVMHKMDSRDISSMRELLEFLEQRSALLELLDQIAQAQGLTISFGNDFYGPGLGEWGIISSPYGMRGQPLGVIGTIGPINMDYSKLVPMVDYIAKMLTQILEQRL